MRITLFSFITIIGLIAWVFLPAKKEVTRINGVSLVNPHSPIESETMAGVKRVNAGWVAVIPYAFSRKGEPTVTFDHARQWWGEKTDGNCMLIQLAQENNLKVMVKPHVWIRGEGWTGDFNLSSEEEWSVWEEDYTKYILNHAVKADSMKVDMLCIGTEYRIPAKERPLFWRTLIAKVREVYGGKITYAANWDNYENITWWDEVDYIGIDAYFPLVDREDPLVEDIERGWNPIKDQLSRFSKQWEKPVVFTEYGFQSVNGAAGKHWEVEKSLESVNEQLQANAYEATFRAMEKEEWYAGGFFWKWHFLMKEDDWYLTEWTPQYKEAEHVIAEWYGKIN